MCAMCSIRPMYLVCVVMFVPFVLLDLLVLRVLRLRFVFCFPCVLFFILDLFLLLDLLALVFYVFESPDYISWFAMYDRFVCFFLN